MPTNFPNSLDAYGTVPTNQQTAVAHRERHQDVEDAIEALEAKVGVDNSAVVTSLDYRVRTLEGNPVGAGLDASRVSYTPPFTGSVTRTGEERLADRLSVKDFGAVGNGLANDSAAINAASAAADAQGNGEVFFPAGTYNFTFTKPPYGVTWEFAGTDILRTQLGGAPSATPVRFMRPTLTYMPGPHTGDQLHANHIYAVAKGSNAIGAQYADYALGITIEKEFWSESGGTPVAGEINGLTIYTRNGAVNGDPVKTGGAAILCNVGQTAGSGYTQVLEAVNSVFTKGTFALEQQTNIQLLGIDERLNYSHGVILNSTSGTQSSAIKLDGSTAAPWTRILENVKDGVLNFRISDTGEIRWRTSGLVEAAVRQDAASGDLIFLNSGGNEIFRIGQTRTTAIPNSPRVATGTSESISQSDHDRIVALANGSAITCELSAIASAGTRVRVLQRDAGQVTFTPAAGATLRNRQGHTKTAGQWAMVTLEVAANSGGSAAIWYLSGDTAA